MYTRTHCIQRDQCKPSRRYGCALRVHTRSNLNDSFDPSVIESLCVSLFSHWKSDGTSNTRIVDLWTVAFKRWPITAP